MHIIHKYREQVMWTFRDYLFSMTVKIYIFYQIVYEILQVESMQTAKISSETGWLTGVSCSDRLKSGAFMSSHNMLDFK